MDFADTVFLDNSLRAWTIALGAALLTYAAVRLVVLSLARRLVHAVSAEVYHWDDALRGGLRATHGGLIVVFSLFVGAMLLTLPGQVRGALQSVAMIALLVQVGLWVNAGLTEWLAERAKARAEEEPAEVMTLGILGVAAKLVLWSLVVLLGLENLGVDVTALVAGLGIGGVAVALAAQNVLGDLFASLSIVLDKPFVLGDFVVVGDYLGSVEAIGLKTTRIRSISGEQVVFSNTDLLESRIRNYGRMYERRVVLQLGVTYQTSRSDLALIPGIVREAIERHSTDRVRFDRVHLSAYGDFAITFEAVYYVLDPDYVVHMDIKEQILLTIHAAFEERAIEYAYPTQTVFVERANAG
ncbi:MAG: hypothetical protein AMS19_03270 [Gemmatimonas sp. SG8_23]|jgi:small-conductance mechanosensitive channel|nr:MAG: hypothetical protein AMS19_03270 [Gemmatimonas sp. SG8_23]